jgi:hypothetical protein
MKNIQLVPIYAHSKLDTIQCIDPHHQRDLKSPMTVFSEESARLRTLIIPTSFDSHLAGYVFLGQMSIVESYFRTIIRNIILIDADADYCVSEKTLSYAAAKYLDEKMIPEALLEGTSFSSTKNISNVIKEFLGLKGHLPVSLGSVFEEFEKVCQIRHCMIHRFSYLGSNNAVKLGINDHRDLIEKPIKLTYKSLQEIFQIIEVTAKTFNNDIFSLLFERLAKNSSLSWKFRSDRKLFMRYYNLFLDETDSNCLSASFVYEELKKSYK